MYKLVTTLTMTAVALLGPIAPAHAYTYNHGAISIGNNGTYAAIVVDYPTWQEATVAANNRCGYTDCGWVITFMNQCAAAAVSSSGHWGWARESSIGYADRVALDWAGAGAQVIVHGCTSGS
ncbi:DUF4189 domain-containing protein [Nocardia tengchongensis]|uniref:DUF4189 domain-containing protein n=1 Tax=Nocardia tengchongensis TaxID=2055889 RepID=UPI0033DD7E30